MKVAEQKLHRQKRRRQSVRRRLSQAGPTVRLTVTRSIKHISAAIFDEAAGKTVCGAATTAKRYAPELAGKSKSDSAAFIGSEIARIAKEKGIETVVFDRGHNKYHGRVKALADAAREGGLKF